MHVVELTLDALVHVMSMLEQPCDIVASAAPVCKAFREAATSDCVWKGLLKTRYHSLVERVFGGVAPPPPPPLSWRAHYFAFASDWMEQAVTAGRVIIMIEGKAHDVTSYLDAQCVC